MKLTNRVLALGVCAVGVTVASFGCGDGTSPSSPVAPSASPAARAGTNTLAPLSVQTAIDEASLGTDTVDLKSTAATPSNPINNAEVDDLTPSLTAANARGLFEDANFNYAFAVYRVVGEWTATQDFRTPAEATAGTPGGATGAPGKGQLRFPNSAGVCSPAPPPVAPPWLARSIAGSPSGS